VQRVLFYTIFADPVKPPMTRLAATTARATVIFLTLAEV